MLRDQNRALIKLVAGLRGLGAVIAAFQENSGVLVDAVDVRRI